MCRENNRKIQGTKLLCVYRCGSFVLFRFLRHQCVSDINSPDFFPYELFTSLYNLLNKDKVALLRLRPAVFIFCSFSQTADLR